MLLCMLLFVRLTSIFDSHYVQSKYAWQLQQEKLPALSEHKKTVVDKLDVGFLVSSRLTRLIIC